MAGMSQRRGPPGLDYTGCLDGACMYSTALASQRLVLIGDVRFVNVVADIATRNTGEEISVSNKHLDQNERLDDFGTRTRP